MKTRFWAFWFSLVLTAIAKAQQPAPLTPTSALMTNSGFEENRAKAEKGDPAAQCALGSQYVTGAGVPQDYIQAAKWYRKAADQGYAPAQYNLAVFYDQDNFAAFYNKGIPQDYVEAAKWYRKAADQGFAPAQYNLALFYHTGRGVELDIAEAVSWYRKAAEQGHAAAQNNLGFCYQYGQELTKDSSEAVNWYRKAAEQGLAKAQYNLGYCYFRGEGVAKDDEKQTEWFRKAAEQGYIPAQYCLGVSYEDGVGVIKDYVQAYKWYILAEVNDYELAKQYLLALAERMTPDQIANGQKLAREFKPSNAEGVDPPSMLLSERSEDGRRLQEEHPDEFPRGNAPSPGFSALAGPSGLAPSPP